MENIKLTLEEETGKILSYEPTVENGLFCIPDGYAGVIEQAKEQGYEVYFRDGRIIKRGKDELKYEDELKQITDELNEITRESKSRLATFINNKSEKSVFSMKEIMEKRSQKLKEQQDLQHGFAEGIKSRMFDILKKNNFKYYCSICLIIRDESEYLKEWLEWHIGQGIQHFYIYDHGSKQPVSEFIKTLDKEIQDKVTIIYFGARTFLRNTTRTTIVLKSINMKAAG